MSTRLHRLAATLALVTLALGGCGASEGDATPQLRLAMGAASGLLKEVAALELSVYDERAQCTRATGEVVTGDAKRLFDTSQESLDDVQIKGIEVGTRVFAVTAYRDRFQTVVGRGCASVTLAESATPVDVKLQLVRVGDPPKQLIFVSERDGPGNSGVFVADFDGANPKRVTTAPLSGDDYTVSSEGLVAFIGLSGSQPKLYTVRADGSGESKLNGASGIDVNPVFSADGKTIYFASNGGGDFDIYSIGVAGGQPKNLTNDAQGFDAFPAVGPDGTVVYLRETGGGATSDLYKISGGGTPTLLANGPFRRTAPRFASNNTVVAVKGQSSRTAPSQIVAVDLSSGGVTDLSKTTSSRDRDPAVSPDGSLVVFSSDRGGTEAVYSVKLDGSGLIKLAEGAQPAVHPDGTRVVFVRGGDVYQVPIGGGAAERLIQHSANESRPGYVP